MDHGLPPRRILPPPVPPSRSRLFAEAVTTEHPVAVDALTDSGRHAAAEYEDDVQRWYPRGLTDTGRHATGDETGWLHPRDLLADSGRHAAVAGPDVDPHPARVRAWGRWVPGAVGGAVAAVAVAVVLSSGLIDGPVRVADEAAVTEAVVPSTPATTAPAPLPVVPTLDLAPGTPGPTASAAPTTAVAPEVPVDVPPVEAAPELATPPASSPAVSTAPSTTPSTASSTASTTATGTAVVAADPSPGPTSATATQPDPGATSSSPTGTTGG